MVRFSSDLRADQKSRAFLIVKLIINLAALLLMGFLAVSGSAAVPTVLYALMVPITAHSIVEAALSLVYPS